jgi:DNA invertase Pin-like site-specific DNA recombinase/DNA-binding CsgD family transcriptional regulator
MARQRDARQRAPRAARGVAHLTVRQSEVLRLARRGLSGKQIARSLGISVRTVEDHFSAMRRRTGARSQSELVAYAATAGPAEPGPAVPETVVSGTTDPGGGCPGQPVPETSPGTVCRPAGTGTVSGTIGGMTTAPAYDNSVRIGYARVSTRTQEHQAQLDALAAAHCREVVIETASTRGDRPKLREALGKLQAGDTLVIYKPDRVARSMKELLVLLEDQLHARGINLHILTGICAGMHRPDGAAIADKMLFMVAAMAAEMERDLIRERTLDGLRAAEAQGRRGGRPAVVNDDVLAVARARQSRGESVTVIARHLKIGRSTLYRALQPCDGDLAPAAAEPTFTSEPR